MKYVFTLLAVLSLVACGGKKDVRQKVSNPKDLSAILVSEQGLNQQGCRFVSQKMMILKCDSKETLVESYTQFLVILEYQNSLELYEKENSVNRLTSLNFLIRGLAISEFLSFSRLEGQVVSGQISVQKLGAGSVDEYRYQDITNTTKRFLQRLAENHGLAYNFKTNEFEFFIERPFDLDAVQTLVGNYEESCKRNFKYMNNPDTELKEFSEHLISKIQGILTEQGGAK